MNDSFFLENKKVLITGILSGLGRYCYEYIGGIGITRNTSQADIDHIIQTGGVDAIIHCAFNSQNRIDSESLYSYVRDNVLLTHELVSIPHKKFIFVSSVDVYPKNDSFHNEHEIIKIDDIKNIYGITKLMSESIIRKYSKNYLIMRATALLGKYSRKNSLLKIIEDDDVDLTLSKESTFNYVLHSDILDFIKFSLDNDLNGIYNIASSDNVTLSEVAYLLKKKVKFGTYVYNVGDIDNSKVSSAFPVFKRTSKDTISRFLER